MEYPDDLIEDGALAAVVGGLLEPLVDNRLPCAEALQLLRGEASPADSTRCVHSGHHSTGVTTWIPAVTGTELSLEFSGGSASLRHWALPHLPFPVAHWALIFAAAISR